MSQNTEEQPIPTMSFGGFTAYVESYVLGGYKIYYASLFGSLGTVKAISAALVAGKSVSLHVLGEFRKTVSKQFGRKYRMISKRLPSRALNIIVLVDHFILSHEHQFCFLASGSDMPVVDRFFSQLVYRTEVPLHVSWAQWLWDAFQKNDWAWKLPSFGIQAHSVLFTDSKLSKLLKQGIQTKQIPEINYEYPG